MREARQAVWPGFHSSACRAIKHTYIPTTAISRALSFPTQPRVETGQARPGQARQERRPPPLFTHSHINTNDNDSKACLLSSLKPRPEPKAKASHEAARGDLAGRDCAYTDIETHIYIKLYIYVCMYVCMYVSVCLLRKTSQFTYQRPASRFVLIVISVSFPPLGSLPCLS